MRSDQRTKKSSRSKSSSRRAKIKPEEEWQVVYPNSAGIDVGSQRHYVAVPASFDPEPVRSFGCFTEDLIALADWLKGCGVTHVVLESTGVYWVPVHQVLSDQGLLVHLVDARQAKNMQGRKTDVLDCQWLLRLYVHGLLNPCFLTPQAVSPLRAYVRHRGSLVEACSQQIQLMQKPLEMMNVQLHKVLSDISGLSGMKIIRKIVAGERSPKQLAMLAHKSVKADEKTILQALTGYYQAEHVFALSQALAAYDFYQAQLRECDYQIQAALKEISPSGSSTGPTDGKDGKDNEPPSSSSKASGSSDPKEPSSGASRRKNQSYFELRPQLERLAGVDLTQITGISALTAQTILSEVGPDLSDFKTGAQFASWLGLCPNHQITGGKIKSRRSRVAQALRLSAQSLMRSRSALGAFLRRIRARSGMPKAITATAHKLARLVYRALTEKLPFVDPGADYYEQSNHERACNKLRQQALKLGFKLVPDAEAQTAS
jgi:transposase